MIFASLFPLSSPIILPARLAFDPPWWQIVLSIVIMLATVWFFIWLTSRIYRVGILTVSYTHLRAHETVLDQTVLDLVCRLLLEKKKHKIIYDSSCNYTVY